MNPRFYPRTSLAIWMLAAGICAAGPSTSAVNTVPSQAAQASPESNAPQPLTADQLDGVSGGQSTIVNAVNTQTLSATTSNNQINAGVVQSGAVSFAKGTFEGFNGIGNFVINTGNNNVLQGSLSVTVVPLR